MVGNYWDAFSGLTGEAMEREHDTSKPWIGDPFENGPEFDPDTASMVSSRKVRNAFAFAIEREALLENLIAGLGFVNNQPYLSENNPNYKDEWDQRPTDQRPTESRVRSPRSRAQSAVLPSCREPAPPRVSRTPGKRCGRR